MSTLKQCAYCGNEGHLTREHIFPSAIIDESYDLSLNDKSQKYFKSDLVVKDVCSKCNNGALSTVGHYFCGLYREYMSAPLLPGDSIQFRYDYRSLLRALLKISFNSARASAEPDRAIHALRKLVSYILGKREYAPGIMLRLLVVTSAEKINRTTGERGGYLEARVFRSAKIDYNGPHQSKFSVRLIALNSFWFYLILPTASVSVGKKRAFLNAFQHWILQPGLALSPSSNSIRIAKEDTTYMHPVLLQGMIRDSR